jgi:iron(III) transport system permease protein
MPAFGFLREGGTAVALASAARFAPFAALLLALHLRRIDWTLVEAARVFEKSRFRSRLRIDGRLAAPGILAAAALVFALAAGETAATLIVAPPGRETLALKIFGYLHYGAVEPVAGLCLFLAGATLALGLLCARLAGTRPPTRGG